MKTTHSAPVGADPMGSFLSSLPPRAKVIAAAGSRSQNRTTLEAVYTIAGQIFFLSIIRKGGRP